MAKLHVDKHQKKTEAMSRYPAAILKDETSCYGVVFPDFPGCVAAGDTVEEAIENAREALAFHVEGMRKDGEVIPLPRFFSGMDSIKEDWFDLDQVEVVSFIQLLPPKGDPVRVNINIDSNLLAAADDAAMKAHQSRSAFIARALEAMLEG